MKKHIYLLWALMPMLLQAQEAPVYQEINTPESGVKVFKASDYISFSLGFEFKATATDNLHAYIYKGTQDYAAATYQNYVDPATTPINKNLPVGSLPGSFNVSGTGAAPYQIPVELPVASVDLMPSISLGYSSQSGNGNAGIGWHLQGFSAITRVSKNNYYDGQRQNITFTPNDAIALDGQRLIYLEGAPHGTTGAVYATEQENYMRITKTNDGYLATLKNGTTMEFGYTADARKLQATDENQELGWLLNKVTDIYGNYYTIHYKNFGFGEVLPEYISYSGNDQYNINTYNQVRFSYMDRDDKTTRYVSGKELKTTKLLSTIHVLSNGKTYRKYLLKYFFDHISKLNQVAVTGVNGIQYNPTIIGWENITLAPQLHKGTYGISYESIFTFGDYSGDGKTDMTEIYVKSSYTSLDKWRLKINRMDTQDPTDFNTINLFDPVSNRNNNLTEFFQETLKNGRFDGLLKVDFNTDGVDDILLVEKGDLNGNDQDTKKTYKPLLAKYQEERKEMNFEYDSINFPRVTHSLVKFSPPSEWITDHDYSFIADVNGDGSSDILTMSGYSLIGGENINSLIYCNLTRFINGAVTTKQYTINDDASNASSLNEQGVKIGDFNGDGKDDIYLFTNTDLAVYSYNANTDKFEQLFTKSFNDYPLEGRFHLGDFNGDGNTDLLEMNYSWANYTSSGIKRGILANYQCYLSNGVDTLITDPFGQAIFTPNISIYFNNLHILDFNGDGRTDILHQLPADHSVPYSYGNTFDNRMYYNFPKELKTIIPDPNTVRWLPKEETQFGDFNGDGIIDIYSKNYEYSDYNSFFHDILYFKLKQTPENVINSIQNGTGKKININIKPLTANGLYHSYYDVEQIIPIPVVHEVSYPQINSDVHERYAYGYLMMNPATRGFLGLGDRKKYDLLNQVSYMQQGQFSKTYQLFTGHNRFYTETLDSNEVLMYDHSGELLAKHSKIQPRIALGNKRFHLKKDEETFTDHINKTKKRITYKYDASGNVIKHKTIGKTYNDVVIDSTVTNYNYTKQGNGTFDNTVVAETKTATRVGQPSVNTTTHYVYNSSTYLLQSSSVNQGSDREINTQYHYNTSLNHLLYTTTTTNETDPSGQVYAPRTSNVATYDNNSRYVITETNALGHSTTVTRMDNTQGLALEIKDANNRITKNTYNGFGQLLSTTNAQGITSNNSIQWYQGSEYPNAWYYTEQKTTGQPTQRTYYNVLGQQLLTETETLHGKTVKSSTEYYNNGQVHKQYLPYVTNNSDTLFNEYLYDSLNRPLQTQYANGTNHTYGYVATGKTTLTLNGTNPTNITDGGAPLPQVQSTQLNEIGQTTAITDALENTTTFAYNSFGSARSTTSFGNQTSFGYDEYGKQTSLTDPNAGNIQYTYNVFGELVTQINADQATSHMYYDVLGRIITQEEPDGRTITYTYDTDENAIGALVNVSDGQGNSTATTYDEYGQVASTTETINNIAYTTSYTYDGAGRLKTHTYPSGFTLSYQYDYMGNVISISNAGTNQLLWEIHEQNAFGQITEYKYGNGIVSQHTYDPYGFLTSIKASDVVDKSYLFQYGTNNLINRTDNRYQQSETFGYDKLNRLTLGIDTNYNFFLSIAYDANGNIQSKSDVGAYSYNSSRPHALTGINTHEDTTNANLMRLQTAEYNHHQDLTWVKEYVLEDGEYEQTFNYNALNQRNYSQLTLNNQTLQEKTYVGEYELISDASTGSAPETKAYHYITAPSGLVGVYVQNTDGTGHMLYTHQDYLGSIIAITDEVGTLQQELSYDAWGRPRRADNHSYDNVETPLLDRGYTLHEHMPVFGLIHMNGRLYDPQVGRMLSTDNNVQDPANGQNYNRYSYVLNNPLKYTDPSGEAYLGYQNNSKYTGPVYDTGNTNFTQAQYQNGEFIGFGEGTNIWGDDIYGAGGGGGGSGGNEGGDPTKAPAVNRYFMLNPVAAYFHGLGNWFEHNFNTFTSVQGWKDMGISTYAMMSIASDPMLQVAVGATVANNVSNYVERLPNMSASEIAYDASGFTANVLVGALLTRGAGAVKNLSYFRGVNWSAKATSQGTNLVYQGFDKAGIVRYIGITERNASIRFAEHLNSGTAKSLLRYEAIPGATGLSRTGARILEQRLINQYGLGKNGGQLFNRINSISPSKWNIHGIQ